MRTFPVEILEAVEAYANKYLEYFPDTGFIKFKIPSSRNKIKPGEVAGRVHSKGYIHISIFVLGREVEVKAHRLAWLMHFGAWPEAEIDHINHVKYDNRIENLRAVSGAENQRNKGMSIKNTSGLTGVHFCGKRNGWIGQYCKDGNKIYVGCFSTKHLAFEAVRSRRALDGFHENHGHD